MTADDLTELRKVLTRGDSSTGAVAPVTLDEVAAGKMLELVYEHERILNRRMLQTLRADERLALLLGQGVKPAPSFLPAKFAAGSSVLHLKSRGVYDIVFTPEQLVIERTWEPAYAYAAHGSIVVRPQAEMEDGRFVPHPTPIKTDAAAPT